MVMRYILCCTFSKGFSKPFLKGTGYGLPLYHIQPIAGLRLLSGAQEPLEPRLYEGKQRCWLDDCGEL
jgi:hypothetical protein